MGLEKWRQKGSRLREMDRAELFQRARQEFTKRHDTLLAKVGFDLAPTARTAGSPANGSFFFNSQSVDSSLAALRQRLPGHAQRIVVQAEKICSRRFDLLGYNDLDYGTLIDWHLDAVHNVRAPRKAFHRVRYLDFAEVGDSKVTWELNRHQHLVTLAKAFRLTGDRRFSSEILLQWRHWNAQNPYPVGINWASSLEVAFRSLSWIWAHQLLQDSPEAAGLPPEWLPALALHARHIERNLSTYFSPNTHLLGEGVALFFIGVMFPQWAAAERWKSLGWKMVLQEAERQVRADGFHFEQSTYYHVYALDFFLHSAVLASLNNVPIPTRFEQTLEKMLDALMLLARAGPPPRFGDDDGGRVFDPRRNRSEHLLDPLSTGAILFQRGDFKAVAGELREETLWLLGIEGVCQWDALETVPSEEAAVALKEAGIYLLTGRTSQTQLVIHAGPHGAQSGGHRHADALSLCLHSRGHALLLDPGTLEYVGPSGDRDLFRGTGMHNTVRVDGLDQAEGAGPFSWQRLPQMKAERWIQGNSFDYVVATHDGYQRLSDPATHRRFVVSLRNGTYLVRDVIEGKGNHGLEIPWHLGPDMQLVEHGLYRVKGASQGLALLTPAGHGWAEELRRESWSPVYGQKAPMTVLRFTTSATLPAEFAVLLVTLEEAHRRPGSLTRIESVATGSPVRGYKHVEANGQCSYVFGEGGTVWHVDGLSSDAEFVCWMRTSGDEQRLILCEGSFAAVDSGIELRCSAVVRWAEVTVKSRQRTVYCSNPAAVKGEEEASAERQTGGASPSAE
jgi:Heparinase II/III-like protein/Heparinase II/III N-terminus